MCAHVSMCAFARVCMCVRMCAHLPRWVGTRVCVLRHVHPTLCQLCVYACEPAVCPAESIPRHMHVLPSVPVTLVELYVGEVLGTQFC